jgi:hypothetical protein
MGDSESEKICACLTESVGDRPVDVFYKEFNLERPTVFAKQVLLQGDDEILSSFWNGALAKIP